MSAIDAAPAPKPQHRKDGPHWYGVSLPAARCLLVRAADPESAARVYLKDMGVRRSEWEPTVVEVTNPAWHPRPKLDEAGREIPLGDVVMLNPDQHGQLKSELRKKEAEADRMSLALA